MVQGSAPSGGSQVALLTVKEVAQRLRVCTATVYALVHKGDLPHVRVLNSIRIAEEVLEAFVGARSGR